MLQKMDTEPSYWTLNYQTSEPNIVARTRNTRYITLVKRVVSIYTGKTKGILMLSVPYDQFASFTAQTPEGEHSCLSFREKLLCGERIALPGWTTISMALEHEDFVFEYAYPFRFFTIFSKGFLLVMTVIMLLFLLGFVLIVFIAERSVTKPVDRLLGGFVRVEKGEFDARMDNDGDEIFGDLNRGFDHMAGHLQSAVNELVDERIRGRELKQRLLLMQIKPHFLYNIFNNMIWLVEQKKYDNLEQLVTATAGFYKSALNVGSYDILLYDNQRQLDYYVRIQKFRFGDRFDLHMEVSEEAQELCIPNLLLQPLVENAISHGFANLDRLGLITLTAWVDDQELLIRVCDNGCGIPPGLLDEIRRAMISGVDSSQRFFALVNVASRLRSRYGGRASIDITSRSGEGAPIARIKRYIHANIESRVSLMEVAEHMQMNPAYLLHYFKENTGVNFVDYCRSLRMKRARELLENTNLKIYEIASRPGYQNAQAFGTAFKELEGITPAAYRTGGKKEE